MQVFIHSNKTMQGKEIPEYATHGKLILLLLHQTRPHNTHTPKPKGKKKGTSLLCRPGRPARSGRIVARMAPNFGCRAHSVVRQLSPTLLEQLLSNNTGEPPSRTSRTSHTTLCRFRLLSNNSEQPRTTTTGAALTHTPFRSARLRLLSSSHAPFGRAFAPSANRASGHASCPSTSQGGVPAALLGGLTRPLGRQPFHDPRRCFHAPALGGKSLRGFAAPPFLPEEIVFTRSVGCGGVVASLKGVVWSMMGGRVV